MHLNEDYMEEIRKYMERRKEVRENMMYNVVAVYNNDHCEIIDDGHIRREKQTHVLYKMYRDFINRHNTDIKFD